MAYDVTQLLTYSQGLVADWAQKNKIAKWLIPEVLVTSKKVFFKIYDSTDGFQVIDTRRAIGGTSARTQLKVTDSTIVLDDNSFETTIDDQERRDNPETGTVLEKIKVRNLTLKVLNNFLAQVFKFIYDNVSVTGTFGVWSGASTVDPVAECDAIIKAQVDTGIPPNKLYFDLTSWIQAKNNKQTLARLVYSGVPTQNVTLEAFRNMLSIPLDIQIGGGLKYEGTSQNNVLIFRADDGVAQEDPSFAKCFTLNPDRFANLMQYRQEEIQSDVYRLTWSQDLVLTGPALATRIQTS
jgi:hypothetical protein